MKKEIMPIGGVSPNAPYSPVVRAGSLLFISGQVAQSEGKLLEGGFEAQCRGCLNQLQALLEAAGSGMDRIVKTTVFMTDLSNFDQLNEIYREVFPSERPSRTCIQVSRIPLDADIEIEAIALAE